MGHNNADENNHDPSALNITLFKLLQPEVRTMPELCEQFVVAKSSPLNKVNAQSRIPLTKIDLWAVLSPERLLSH
jgi:hypothetical protein